MTVRIAQPAGTAHAGPTRNAPGQRSSGGTGRRYRFGNVIGPAAAHTISEER